MEIGLRTPLLDFFRRGEVARDVRLLAAQGVLAPRALEQLALLAWLVDDGDAEVASAAAATLDAIPRAALSSFLARSDVPSELRAFFAGRGIEPAATASDGEGPLVDASPGPEPRDGGEDEESMLRRIQKLNVPRKIALALKGTREERAILIRDPNKLVALAVLSSPKLTETEVESIARMASVSDEILRIISSTRAWMRHYPIVVALARNPKTPLAVSMNLLPRLNDRDLRMLSTDRNVPEVLRVTARKKVVLEK